MDIKTHLESRGINTSCCVCGFGYELIPSDFVPYTHEAYRHGEHLGVICCDCYTAGHPWIRTMLELSPHEVITEVIRPRGLEISSGAFAGSPDPCETCGEPIPDDAEDVVLHLRTAREGFHVLTLSHEACRATQVATEHAHTGGHARLCLLQRP